MELGFNFYDVRSQSQDHRRWQAIAVSFRMMAEFFAAAILFAIVFAAAIVVGFRPPEVVCRFRHS